MDCLAATQHVGVLFDSLRARLGLLRFMHAIQDRVAVNPVELIEVAPGGRIAIEHRLEIFRHLSRALRRIRSLPSSIEFRLFDLLQPGRLHAAELDQNRRARAIELRPLALRTSRRETDQPILGVEPVGLPVNPSVTERTVDRFPFRNARNAGRSLGQLQPHALRRSRLLLEPILPRSARCERANGKIVFVLRRHHSYALPLCVLIRARQVVV